MSDCGPFRYQSCSLLCKCKSSRFLSVIQKPRHWDQLITDAVSHQESSLAALYTFWCQVRFREVKRRRQYGAAPQRWQYGGRAVEHVSVSLKSLVYQICIYRSVSVSIRHYSGYMMHRRRSSHIDDAKRLRDAPCTPKRLVTGVICVKRKGLINVPLYAADHLTYVTPSCLFNFQRKRVSCRSKRENCCRQNESTNCSLVGKRQLILRYVIYYCELLWPETVLIAMWM